MRKYITLVIIAVCMLILFNIGQIQAYAGTYTEANVKINNSGLNCETSPVIVNGIAYVPAKEAAKALGIQGTLDIKTLSYSLKYQNNSLDMKLDNSIVMQNGKYIKLSGSLKIIKNRFMIPVKWFEQLGMYTTQSDSTYMIFKPQGGKIIYKIRSGDYLWKISQMFGTSIATIKSLNGLTSDSIYSGQALVVKTTPAFATSFDAVTGSATIKSGPGFGYSDIGYLVSGTKVKVTGKDGLWYKVTTPKGEGYIYYTVIKVTQAITDTTPASNYFSNKISYSTSNDSVTYSNYAVSKGDTLWTISEKVGLPVEELASANGLTTSSYLTINQVLKVPVHKIGKKAVLNSGAGELLDWFSQAQYVLPIGKKATVIDVETGKSFNIQRTMGSSHSDTETLTTSDTQIMKSIFGGTWNWNKRAFILQVDGRKFAVSIAGMPHAGVDSQAFLANVSNRSGSYGYGPNYDRIKGNGMNGHFDLYFLNGLGHSNNKIDSVHQKMVSIAGGLK